MSFLSQLCLLLGKHFTLRRRQPVTLLVELVWPIILILIVALIKRAAPPATRGPCFYKPIQLPQGDFVSFARSFACNLDYKCHETSKLNDFSIETNLGPLVDIAKNEASFAKLLEYVPILKAALVDVNNLTNNEIFKKIENGTISINDFLNSTEKFKNQLVYFGLKKEISEAFLRSQFRIIEIYKELKLTDKIKETQLCNPIELVPYLIAKNSDPFLKMKIVNGTNSKDDFQIAELICSLSKRTLISDVDLLLKQFNLNFFTNYTNTIAEFFANEHIDKTIHYLTQYLNAGKDFSTDLALFDRFTNFNDIIGTIRNAIRLLDLMQGFDPQLNFLKQMMKDFAPIFSTLPEFNQMEALLDLTLMTNKIFRDLENKFTVESVFNNGYANVLEKHFNTQSNAIQKNQLNVPKLLEFILRLKFSDPHEALCSSPKINGLFKKNVSVTISQVNVDTFCRKDTSPFTQSKQIADSIYENLNYNFLVTNFQSAFTDSAKLNEIFSKLENFNLQHVNFGSANDVTQSFGIIKSLIQIIEEAISDKSTINTKNAYEIVKRLVKLFAPKLIGDKEWTYIDIFIPMILPTLDAKNDFKPVTESLKSEKFQSYLSKTTSESLASKTISKNETLSSIISTITSSTTSSSTKSSIPITSFTSTTSLASSSATSASTRVLSSTRRTLKSFSAPSNFNKSVYIAPRRGSGRQLNNLLGGVGGLGALGALGSLSSLGLLGGGSSGTNSQQQPLSILENIIPLLGFLPLEQLFPGSNPQDNYIIMSSLPMIVNIINSLTKFNFQSNDPAKALEEWKNLINDFKSKTQTLVKTLTAFGKINQKDAILIESILESANLDKITSPNAVGQISIVCQGVNIWSLIQPDKTLRTTLKSISNIMDLTDYTLNTTVRLIVNDNTTFACTNNTLNDYYMLTKNLNLLNVAAKLKELFLNENKDSLVPFIGLNCGQIDKIYSNFMRMSNSLDSNTTLVLQSKLGCFKESILNPIQSIFGGVQEFLNSAETNADTIVMVATQFNKFIDLVKLLAWINNTFKKPNSLHVANNIGSEFSQSNLLSNSTAIAYLVSIMPKLFDDVNKMKITFSNMSLIQSKINISAFQNIGDDMNLFEIVDSLKGFQKDINTAKKEIISFVDKYDQLIQMTSYSKIISDIRKGIESLTDLLNFFTNNINGIKIDKLFINYTTILDYLVNRHGLTQEEADSIGDSSLFYNPQKLYNLYLDMRRTICNAKDLNYLFKNKISPFIHVNDGNREEFWPQTSKFLCGLSTSSFVNLSNSFTSEFELPQNIKDIFGNETTLMSLSKNNTIFNSLMNTSVLQAFQNSSSLGDMNELINQFNQISHTYAPLGLPTIMGKALCGNDFNFRLEDYGFSMKTDTSKPLVIQVDNHDSRFNLTSANDTHAHAQFDKEEFCNRQFAIVNNLGPAIRNLIKPLLFGKIIYTPRTNVTSQIIQKINETFAQFDQLTSVIGLFSQATTHFDEFKNLTQNLSSLLENQFYQDFIQIILLQQNQINLIDIKSFVYTLYNITTLSDNWLHISDQLRTARNVISCFEMDRFVSVDSENELVDLAAKFFSNGSFLAGIVFENVKYTDKKVPDNLKIKLRMNIDNVPETNLLRPWLWTANPSDNLYMDLRYLRGFVQLQNLLERALISFTLNETDSPITYLQQFPFPKYKAEDSTVGNVNYFILPILVTLMWTGNIGLAIRNLVKEKEKFIEETMKAMGLRSGINWLAWFLSTFMAMILVALVVSLILKFGGIYPLTDLSIIFIAICSFAFSAIMLSFFVGSFFSKTNLASLIGVLAYFISYLPFILVMSIKYEISILTKAALCLSSATAFGYSSLYMSWYEQQGKGLTWNRVWESPINDDQMNFSIAILFMIADGLIYGLLGWYVKNVLSSGSSKPWYFIFAPKFWSSFIVCQSKSKLTDEYLKDRSFRGNKKGPKSKDKNIETEPFHLPVGISIKGLTKKFKDKAVVQNLSLNFFEGQITALLGHNGAGKSTTINVLTGIYAPSSGTAYIYNRDVRYEYNEIRKNVGICPQHDVLFEYMTVKEHLLFYGNLKENMGTKELKRDINDMMLRMGLNPYANDLVSCLSGGLRRRLEVAIAFVAGSKTVILDEPTSGVDPYNRMKIWDIILNFRVGRTILLTTHYLDEADVLSDRIAIIHQGKLQCCGSSMFLKNRYGNGYILTIDRRKLTPAISTSLSQKSIIQHAREKAIENLSQFIGKRVVGSSLTRSVNNQLTFVLPYSQKFKFEKFFEALDENKDALGVDSYGISDTTLEEIFLFLTTRDENGELVSPTKKNEIAEAVCRGRPTHESDKDSGVAFELQSQDAISCKSSPKTNVNRIVNLGENKTVLSKAETAHTIDAIEENGAKSTKLEGKDLYLQQFFALILKRFHHYRRNIKVLLTNILLPCLFVALSMGFTMIRPKLTTQISLDMNPEIYTPHKIFFAFAKTKDINLNLMSSKFIQTFNKSCKDNYQLSNNNLCSTFNQDKCGLMFQYDYNRDKIGDSLEVFSDYQNCSIDSILLRTHNDYLNERFGGIQYADGKINDPMYKDQSKILVWFQNQAYHALPSFLHEFYKMYSQSKHEIFNHPISLSDDRISYDTILQKIADIGISITILCAYAFVPAGFVVYIVRERITQEKRLQFVCGVRPFLYWLSAFVWDFLYYLVIIGLTLVVICSFNVSAYTANQRNLSALVLLLIMFGWSSLPMSYMLARFFNDTGTAYMIVFCFTLFSGIATCITVFLLSFIAESNTQVRVSYQFLEKFCLLFPSYNLGSGLIELTKNQIIADTYAKFGIEDSYKDPFSMDMLGYKFLALALTGIMFFLCIVYFESTYSFNSKCAKIATSDKHELTNKEDHDVTQERLRIQNNEARSDILLAKNFTKRYNKVAGSRVLAVDNICFSIPWGQCFGLLGVNGAGKTTTFKMITGEEEPTFGSRLFNGMSMRDFLKKNIIGYCPQFDAVDEYLTGQEALYCYAKLMGLVEVDLHISTVIKRFKLQSFVDIPIVKYSGGMKRTLSVAVSMLGNPQICLMDEPTNAMDPEMRRRVWDNILRLIREDRSVLLTSHSMAECDVLCTRLAIMVNGKFMCLGTTTHLKNRFGGGYTLQIKVLKDVFLNAIIDFIEVNFQNSILKDKHGHKLEFIIPHKGNSLGKIFGFMEINKDSLGINDYSVSQTTLDQVFINFAKSQRDTEEDENVENAVEDEVSEAKVVETQNELNIKEENESVYSIEKSNSENNSRAPSLKKNLNEKKINGNDTCFVNHAYNQDRCESPKDSLERSSSNEDIYEFSSKF